MTPNFIYPDWPAPASVRALCTTRHGGVSAAPFDSLNLGDHVGDDPAAVQANRALLAQCTGVPMRYLQQVHACDVVALHDAHTTNTTPLYSGYGHNYQAVQKDSVNEKIAPPVADACYSTQPGVTCAVLVADCLPVLFCHSHYPIVAAAHAGWRGLAGVGADGVPAPAGVLENTLRHMQQALSTLMVRDGGRGDDIHCNIHRAHGHIRDADRSGMDMENGTDSHHPNKDTHSTGHWLAWLGPCIGPDKFEVGHDVRDTFIQALHAVNADAVAACFVPSTQSGSGQTGKWLAHLPALARLRLHALGIDAVYGNDGSALWCTASNPQRYFSYRMQGRTGRMAACIWLDAAAAH